MCSFSIKILLESAIKVFWIPSVKDLITFDNFIVLHKRLGFFSWCPVSTTVFFKAFSFDFPFLIQNISLVNQFIIVIYCYNWFDDWFLKTFNKFYKGDFLSNRIGFSYFPLICCFPLRWYIYTQFKISFLVH